MIPFEGRLDPTFPDTELAVGDEWSNEQTLDLLGEEVAYTTANQITGMEETLVVIDSTTTVSAFDSLAHRHARRAVRGGSGQ